MAALKTRLTVVPSLFAVLVSTIVSTDSLAMTERSKPAANMQDLKQHFATCLRLPPEAASTRPTFYFSLTRQGTGVAHPRIVWFGFKGTPEVRMRLLPEFESSFLGCLPLDVTSEMASTLPGEVYFLQYVLDSTGQTSAVVFRPFGSHGGGSDSRLPLESPEEGFVPPTPGIELREPPARRDAFGPPRLRAPFLLLRPRIQRYSRTHR